MQAIDVRQLSKTYAGGVEAVKPVSFAVEPGEVFGLLGPNGAGKSTTIGMLTTTVAPTAGAAFVAGYDVASDPIDARRASAVVFQDAVVDRGLSGRRNLEIHARLWGLDPSTATLRIDDAVDTFGLDDLIDRPVSTYSGGERRRLEIARSLLSRPQVLFLDEPTVGLDPRIRFELLDLIGRLRDRAEMTILLTTHYLDEAQQLADRVAVLRDGLIVKEGSPAELVAASRTEIRYRENGEVKVVATEQPTRVLHELTSRAVSEGRELDELEVRRGTLEDVYLDLLREEEHA
jgi:ABC-2 type transport system ATP-binding protein